MRSYAARSHGFSSAKPRSIVRRRRPHATVKPTEQAAHSLVAEYDALDPHRHLVCIIDTSRVEDGEKGKVQVADIRKKYRDRDPETGEPGKLAMYGGSEEARNPDRVRVVASQAPKDEHCDPHHRRNGLSAADPSVLRRLPIERVSKNIQAPEASG
jgi:hypothetical protein